MAFKFNAILDFNNKDAIKGMAEVSRGFKTLKDGAAQLSKGVGQVNTTLKGVVLATAPLGAALGYGIKQAADFEAKMSLVQGELMATKDEIQPVVNAIKLLGATGKDVDKASDAALAFADAGFEVNDIVKALPASLNLMTAAQMDAQSATQSIIGVMKSFSLSGDQANDVVDTLALTANLSTVSVSDLAEGMRLVSGVTRDLGFDFRQTASAIGILAEGGLTGTQAAGALKNAFNTLSSPTKETIALFGGSKKAIDEAVFSVVDGKKQFKSLEVVMANLSKVVNKAPDPLKAVAAAADIFGVKGTEAFRKFEQQLLDTTTINEKNIERIRAGIKNSGEDMQVNIGDVIPKLVAFRLEIAGAAGSAAQLAKINTANAKSNFEKLVKIAKNLNREVGDLALQSFGPLLKQAVDFATVVAVGFELASGRIDAVTAAATLGDNKFKDYLQTAKEFSEGFIEGFKEVKEGAIDAFNTVREILEPIMGATGMTSKEFGKLAAKIFFIGAIVAPIAAVVFGAFAVIGSAITGVIGVVNVLVGLWGVVSGAVTIFTGVVTTLAGIVGWPFLLIAAGIALVIAGFVGIIRRWDQVKAAFADGGFIEGIKAVFSAFFAGIGDMILLPITLLKNAIIGLLKWVVPIMGKIGSTIFSGLFGNPVKDTISTAQTGLNQAPAIVNDAASASIEANKIQAEKLKQQTLVQPPSAKDIASESALAGVGSGGGGGGTQKVDVSMTGELRTKISGNDLNIILTRAQVSQAEKNGRTVDPSVKRQAQQNGMAFSQ